MSPRIGACFRFFREVSLPLRLARMEAKINELVRRSERSSEDPIRLVRMVNEIRAVESFSPSRQAGWGRWKGTSIDRLTRQSLLPSGRAGWGHERIEHENNKITGHAIPEMIQNRQPICPLALHVLSFLHARWLDAKRPLGFRRRVKPVP